jgi:hypothetical protein
VVDLKDIHTAATRVGEAIVIWHNVLVRTKHGDAAGSSFHCLPLPLPQGPVKATKVVDGISIDFCRGKDAVYLSHEAGHHAFRDGAWQAAPAADCPAIDAGEPPIVQSGGALWRRNDGALFFDPFFDGGAFAETTRLEAWSHVPPRTLMLQVGGRTHVIQMNDGALAALKPR